MKRKTFFLIIPIALVIFSLNNVQAEKKYTPALTNITVLDLQTAQKVALQDNPNLAAAMSRIEQAKARIEQAAAAWWPSIDISMSGSRTWVSNSTYAKKVDRSSRDGQPVEQTTDQFTGSAQVTWILFNGFYRKFKQQQAEINEQTLVADSQNSRRLIALAVAESFLNAQLIQTNIEIAQADEKFYQQQLYEAKIRYEAGAGSWGDVLNIKVQLNSAQTRLIVLKRSIESAEYGLAALMGINDALLPQGMSLALLDEKQVISNKIEANKSEELIKKALSARPEIRRLKLLLKETEAGQGMAKSRFYPRIHVDGTIYNVRQEDIKFSDDDFSNRISINASWNLFSGGADRARLFELRQKEREITHNLSALRNNITSEVRQHLVLLQGAREQVHLQRKSVELVQENRDMAKSEYEAGAVSLIRLTEAQQDLNRTRSRLAQALVSYNQVRHRLLAATGENDNLFTGMIANKVEK